MGATAMITAGIVGGGLDVIGATQKANNQRQAGEYYQNELDTNANLAESQANATIQAGDQKASIIGLNTREKVGGITAGLAGQGVDVAGGTGAGLKDQTTRIGAMDALIAKTNAFREASGLRTQASAYRLKGSLLRQQSNNEADDTLLTGGLDFARSLIGSASNALDYKWKVGKLKGTTV